MSIRCFVIFVIMAIIAHAMPVRTEGASVESAEQAKPFGIGVTYFYQEQSYSISDLDVRQGLVSLTSFLPNLAGIDVVNSVTEVNVKLDAWLLPFLNVFGLVGSVDGETEIGLPPPFSSLCIDYDGLVYGGGATLAGGWKDLFVSLTATYTDTELDTTDSSITAWVVTPKVGVCIDGPDWAQDLAFWVGAMYQEIDEVHEGSITIPGIGVPNIPIDYDVELEEEDPWNYVAGASVTINKRWCVELEGGVGDREHVNLSVTWRLGKIGSPVNGLLAKPDF